MKKLLSLIFMAFIPIAMMADDPVEIDGIYYNLIPKAKIARVTSNPNGYTGDIVIPSTVTYDNVTCNVIEIDYRAFTGCTGLTSIDIPESVTSIAIDAFNGCKGLTSINIPESVTSISGSAFGNCSGLTSITVSSGNTVYDSRNNCNAIIEKSTNTMVVGCKNTNIPNDVTSIGGAFSGCTGLTSIDIPNSVTSIGGSAFSGCTGLTSVTIPNSVTSIGERAFSGCSGITSINIPESVTRIEGYTFQGCSSLTSINIPENVTIIGAYAFYGCSSLTYVVLPNSLEEIGFNGMEDIYPTYLEYHCCLEDFVISNNYYGPEVTKIVTLVIGDEIEYVGGTHVGYYCPSNNNYLKNVTIGTGVAIITNSFNNCENLDVVTCRATTLPAVSSSFNGSYIEYATLIVPDEAFDAYSTTEPWSNFGTILKASQISTVTANDYTREYGDTNPSEWEYTVVGQALDGEPARTCTADATSAPGTYPIIISQGTVTNEHVTYVNGTLTITKAPLTITANSYTIKEGNAMPTFDAVFTGLKNSESKSVVSPVVSCTATDSKTPGTYDINVTATSDNYAITIVKGTLTILPTKMEITIGSTGMATYCSAYDLDFSGIIDFKACIATGYNRTTGNVIMQPVSDAPAGTGLYLQGAPGTYDVPCGESGSFFVNLLVGTTAPTTISPVDGNYKNLILYNGSNGVGFYTIADDYTMGANKAYLQLPAAVLGGSAGANRVGVEFEDSLDGIENIDMSIASDAVWYSIDGRQLNGKPSQKGIYVVNGRKVVIK